MSQSNARIKVLRTDDISDKTDVIADGQPIYDKATKRLLVGDGSSANSLINAVDCVIDSNTTTTNKLNKFWIGTESEYNAISTKDSNTLYFVKES